MYNIPYMKNLLILIFCLITVRVNAQQVLSGSDYIYKNQVSVGKTNANVVNITPSLTSPSAWLEVGKDSTNKGLLIARVLDTTVVASPAKGLLVYQIKDSTLYFHTKSRWVKLSDVNTLSGYVKISDSTLYYYPLRSNPKGYLTTESDPVANGKTVTLTQGLGIFIGGASPQFIGNNPSFTITADNTTSLWNANSLRNISVSAASPSTNQVLQFNGINWAPATLATSGSVNSVGLSLPSDIYNITGSPVTNTGTLTGTFKSQLANTVWASPNGTTGAPSFRSMVNNDLPVSGAVAGTYGSDTTSAQITVNTKGVAISVLNLPLRSAVANGTTKGIASFGASDFNSSSGNIAIDYANAQMASPSQNGFMSNTTQTIGGNKQFNGAVTFAGNGTPAAGLTPIGTDGLGNWAWGLPNTELIATLDNIDIMAPGTYTLVPAVPGKRILVTYGIYETRSFTGSGNQTYTLNVGTNSTTYDNVMNASATLFTSLGVGAFASTLAPSVTQSISGLPVILKITPGSPVITAGRIRVFMRYALLDL